MQICYISPVQKKKPLSLDSYTFLRRASLILAVSITNIQSILAEDPFDRMDAGGNKLLKGGQRIGYWVCIIMCIFEIIKKVKDGDTNAIYGIITKYALAYGSLFAVKWVLDMIGGFFS